MAMSTYLKQALVNATLRNTAYTSPATVYVSAHTGDPGLTGANEVTGNAYARTAVTMGAPSAGVSTNSAQVEFPAATPSTWGTITHFGIWDASTSGNFLYGAALTASKTIAAGNELIFKVGQISVTLT